MVEVQEVKKWGGKGRAKNSFSRKFPAHFDFGHEKVVLTKGMQHNHEQKRFMGCDISLAMSYVFSFVHTHLFNKRKCCFGLDR